MSIQATGAHCYFNKVFKTALGYLLIGSLHFFSVWIFWSKTLPFPPMLERLQEIEFYAPFILAWFGFTYVTWSCFPENFEKRSRGVLSTLVGFVQALLSLFFLMFVNANLYGT